MKTNETIVIVLVIAWFIAFMSYPSISRILIIHKGIISLLALFLGMKANELQNKNKKGESEKQ